MKKFLILLIISLSGVFSCTLDKDELYGNFWAHNYTTNQRYRIQADLLAEGGYCDIWVERGSAGNTAMAQEMADEFDGKIYHKMLNTFGYTFSNQDGDFDTLSYADYLGDRNGKLCILLLNINSPRGDSDIAGYFWADDLFQGNYSNMRDMIYINIGNDETMYTTIAHELQHLMNYVTGILVRPEAKAMDIWIEEGLSLSAEWVYTGRHLQDRIKWYTQNGNSRESSLLNKGNNFFIWGNRTDEYADAVMDDYATVYLFFQWLRLHSPGGTAIYKDIITSEHSDTRAVTDAAAKHIDDKYKNNWELLLGDWLEANYKNEGGGLYGYKNDADLKEIQPHFLLEPGTVFPLFPGEAIFSHLTTDSIPAAAGYMRYSSVSNSINGDALLSYNVDIRQNGGREDAFITGISP